MGVEVKRVDSGAEVTMWPHAALRAPCATVAVFGSLAAARADWDRLLAEAPASPYQTYGWLGPWLAAEGAAAGILPMIVVAYDESGRPTALLPLGVQRRGLIRRAVFLGGRHANYNMGLFAPGAAWRAEDVLGLLQRAAALSKVRLDLYSLRNQPESWDGVPNPLAALPHQQSPSFGHRGPLVPDSDLCLKALLSGNNRKKLRAKRAHLAALGPIEHRVARTPAEIEAVLAAYLRQKSAKLVSIGAPPPLESPVLLSFLSQAAREAVPPVELHALHCGDRIVATFGGMGHARRFSGLLISYDAEPAVARCSPGELLLADVVAVKCRQAFDSFDLGVGEARYKDAFCPIVDPLFDSFMPLTAAGRLLQRTDALWLRTKRALKRSDRAWAMAQRARRLYGRLTRRQRD